ncbi:MAG: hypothetical protein IRZ14_21115, partial [Chloroflexi bacterium]|nr:hypothetical protein [Chloroflexota bacterium]
MVVTRLDAQQVWQAALGELQLQMSRPNFETWFKDTVLVALDNGCAVIGVPNPFTMEWLQTRCVPLIRKTLLGIVGQPVEVQFVLKSAVEPPRPPELRLPARGRAPAVAPLPGLDGAELEDSIT